MPYENLLYDVRDQIGYVTFNRPKVLNALNHRTMEEFGQILEEARGDRGVRVLIITGAGEKSFIAGADIGDLAKHTPITGKEHSLWGQAILHKLENAGQTEHRGAERVCARRWLRIGARMYDAHREQGRAAGPAGSETWNYSRLWRLAAIGATVRERRNARTGADR